MDRRKTYTLPTRLSGNTLYSDNVTLEDGDRSVELSFE